MFEKSLKIGKLELKIGKFQPHANFFAKILCVVVAFFLWIYVMAVESPEHEQTFSHVTVELIGTDQLVAEHGLAIYNGYNTKIDVTLSGKKSVVSKLTDKDLIATADVSSITGGAGRYNCKINVDVPSGCQLVGTSQDTVSVYLDEAMQIFVPLTETRENTNLPEGRYTGTIDFPVDQITVSGPAKELVRIAKAVVNLDLSGVRKTATMTQRVTLVDAKGEKIESPYLDYYPTEVTVTVPVLKTVNVPVIVTFKNGFLNFSNTNVNLSKVQVSATGDAERIDQGNLMEPIVLDEAQEFSGGRCEKTVTLKAADGVTLSDREITVTAEVNSTIKTRNITVPGHNIEDKGGKDGVEYTWVRSPITITIMGELDKITKIKADDITLHLDMSPYSQSNTGTIRVKADVVIDSPYKNDVLAIGSYEVSVTFIN